MLTPGLSAACSSVCLLHRENMHSTKNTCSSIASYGLGSWFSRDDFGIIIIAALDTSNSHCNIQVYRHLVTVAIYIFALTIRFDLFSLSVVTPRPPSSGRTHTLAGPAYSGHASSPDDHHQCFQPVLHPTSLASYVDK